VGDVVQRGHGVSWSAAGEGDPVEELAGGADDRRADGPRRGGVGVHDDVDQQVAGGVLDVDLRAVARPVGGELVPDRCRRCGRPATSAATVG
jgi:hypothetical protein